MDALKEVDEKFKKKAIDKAKKKGLQEEPSYNEVEDILTEIIEIQCQSFQK